MKRSRIQFIPTRIHGLLDFAAGMLLLGSPWFFQFDHGSAETWVPILLGSSVMLYSLFTDYEWSVSRTIPMPIHLLLDVTGGLLLAAAPWLFGFAHAVQLPHVLIGLGEVAVALLTSPLATEASLASVKRGRAGIGLMLAVGYAACGPAESSTYTVTTMAAQRLTITREARLSTSIAGFHQPESVLYDEEQDVLFVSNIDGAGSDKDGIGYIVRIAAGDYTKAELFIQSGSSGVLDAPKGMAIRDSILWVTDIDVLRGFHRYTGRPAATIDLRPYGAILLNDVDTGPDGALYVTDSAIRMTEKGTIYENGDRIFAISRSGAVSVVAQGEELRTPNGIKWDDKVQRWIVAAFDPFQSMVYELPRTPGGAPKILARGPGNFDGIEVLNDGSIVVTCWDDFSVHMIRNGKQLRIAANIQQPADLGYDSRRNRLLIPSLIFGHVEVWQLSAPQ